MNTLSLWLERSALDPHSLLDHWKDSENAGMWCQVSGNWESTWNFGFFSISSFKCHVQVVILPPFPPWFLLLALSLWMRGGVKLLQGHWFLHINLSLSPLASQHSPIPRSSIISVGFVFSILVVSIQMWRKDLWGFVQVWSHLPALGYEAGGRGQDPCAWRAICSFPCQLDEQLPTCSVPPVPCKTRGWETEPCSVWESN